MILEFPNYKAFVMGFCIHQANLYWRLMAMAPSLARTVRIMHCRDGSSGRAQPLWIYAPGGSA
jgi:hypothetical protein